MRRTLSLLAINVLVLAVLVLGAEAVARVVEWVDSCFDRRACGYAILGPNEARRGGERTVLLDPAVGYVPLPGLSRVVDAPGTKGHGTRQSHDAEGMRLNGGGARPAGPAILALGDSFTYGLNVSDDETWPACVERRLGRPVFNAGVNGYGSAQAVRWGAMLAEARDYDTVILSVLVSRDLDRDRHTHWNGLPRPSVVMRGGMAVQTAAPEDLRGTPWADEDMPPVEAAVAWLRRWSLIVNGALERVSYGGGRLRTELAADAAPVETVAAFTLEALDALPARRRVLLLQYPRNVDASAVAAERAMLLALAERRGLSVIDSYDAVQSRPAAEVWDGHHTVLGNDLVCDAIVGSGALD